MRINTLASRSQQLAIHGGHHRHVAAPAPAFPRQSLGHLVRVASLVAILAITCCLLPAQSGIAPQFTEHTGVVGVQSLTAGPDGGVWFAERSAGKIGTISKSGAIVKFELSSSAAGPRIITKGPDGALWFTEGPGNKIGRITTSGAITEFPIPTANASALGITAGPDGALWFAESNGANSKIGRITVAGEISEFALSPERGPNMITLGPDGALWFTEYWANKIGRITTAGAITEFQIPTPNAGAFGITAGPDGALWFTESSANKIGRITTTGVVTEYTVPTSGAGPSGITPGPDGALWFTETSANQIGRITTAGVINEYALPSPTTPFAVAAGPDGALWLAADTRIGRAQLPKSRTGALSHIAVGGSWATAITLVNPSSVAVPVTVAFRDGEGSAMSLPVAITQQGASQSETASSLDVVVNANAVLLISMAEQVASTKVGWAEVLSPGSLCGFAIFRNTPQAGQTSEGTVPLETQFPSTMILPYDNTGGFVMGVALANMSGSSVTVTATIWDENGNRRGTSTFPMAGNGHTSFVLPTELPMTGGTMGIVHFESSETGGLAGLGLRFSPQDTFTSLPTIR